MKILNSIFVLFVGMSFVAASCAKDDDYTSDKEVQKPTSSITRPTFEKYLTTTTTDQVSLRCRFNNGGDITDNMSCIVHWKQYASKPSSTPKASDMSTHESMANMLQHLKALHLTKRMRVFLVEHISITILNVRIQNTLLNQR